MVVESHESNVAGEAGEVRRGTVDKKIHAGENESRTTNQNTRRKEATAQEKTSCGELQRADIAY
jgi:hypothetical protein